MKIYKCDTINTLLKDTHVSNVFLELYLPHLSGDSVRVYLYALMRSNVHSVFSNEGIADALGISTEAVLSAWAELESDVLIRRVYHNEHDKLNFDVEFEDIRGKMFAPEAKTKTKQTPKRKLTDDNVKNLLLEIEKITGRPLPAGDYQKIAELLTEFDAEPDLIIRAYHYCLERKRSTAAAYVISIIKDWITKGILTAKDAEDHIEVVDIRFGIYRKIMKALGLAPQALTDAEKRTFDTWLDEYGLSVDEIIDVTNKAAGKQNKYDYVKKIIENNVMARGGGSAPSTALTGRKKFYTEKRRKNELSAEARRSEVIAALPRVLEVEADISRLNMDMTSLILSSVAGKDTEVARLSAEIDRLVSEKEKLMTTAGFTIDYMEIKYDCEFCQDTGLLESGASCRCFETHEATVL